MKKQLKTEKKTHDYSFYSPEAKHSSWRIMEILYGPKTVFGYNSAESEPIVRGWPWQIFGVIRAVTTV